MGRGSSGARNRGTSTLRSVTKSQIQETLKRIRDELGNGDAPMKITVNGVEYSKSSQQQYESNGGYIVHTYVYRANDVQDDKSTLEFYATDYMTPAGEKHPDDDITKYSRMKPRIWNVNLSRGGLYSFGSSGGIGRIGGRANI